MKGRENSSAKASAVFLEDLDVGARGQASAMILPWLVYKPL
jgi:hypothetical protein